MNEQQLMEMRVDSLNQQEMKKLKSNNELLKTLHNLNKSIKETALSVQRSAHEVRSYPTEVISKATARMEQTLKTCEQSAITAQETYNVATNVIFNHEKLMTRYMFLWTICGSIFASLMTGNLFVWLMRT